MNRKVVFQWAPGVEYGIVESLSVQTVYENGVKGLTVMVIACYDESIIPRNSEDMWQIARLADILDLGERHFAVVDLHPVVSIPVACNQHASAVEFHSTSRRPFLGEAAKARETMGDRIVHLDLKTLSDT